MFAYRCISAAGARFRVPANILLLIVLGASLIGCPLGADSKAAESDEKSLKLITKLAGAPSLISYEYLSRALGAPNRIAVLPGGLARQAEWFDIGTNQLRYRYQQEFGLLVQGGEVRNHFEVILHDGTRIDLHDLAKRLETTGTSQFNDRANPKEVFKVSPNMTLEVYQPGNYRALSEISLAYVGPSLPPPPQAEIAEAFRVRREEAFEQIVKGCHAKAAPLLSSYLRDFPNDAEVHLKLADCYRAYGCLNQAINQYSLAYALSASNLPMRQAAMQGLQALKVCPAIPSQPETSPTTSLASQKAEPDPFAVDDSNHRKSIAASGRAIDPGF